MKVDFQRLTWEDYPSRETPINAENLNRLEEGVGGLYSDVSDMQEYVGELDLKVDTKCDELDDKVDDVHDELDEKIDEIYEYAHTEIVGAVEDWLNEHVDPTGSAVVVDNTLSIEGAAADAKTTGELLLPLGLSVVDGCLCITYSA